MSERTLPVESAVPEFEPAPGSNLNLLGVLSRRWPLLAVGLAVGVTLGVLIHLTSTKRYQSRAEVLVTRQLNVASPGESAGRGGAVDDYVGAQLTIIKSEVVRRNAATELRKMQSQLSNPLPEDDGELAELIRQGLGAARERESSMAGTIGSGIVNITFRWTDPNDAKVYLDAVLRAYQNVLAGVYDSATRATIDYNRELISSNENKLRRLRDERLKLQKQLSQITTEDVNSVRARVSSIKDSIFKFNVELLSLQADYELAKKAGPNQKDRQEVLAQLTGFSQLGLRPNDLTLEGQRRTAMINREVLGQKLGKDHPEMKALAATLEMLDEEIKRQNPEPDKALDQLGAVTKRLEQNITTTKQKIDSSEAKLADDEAKLIAAAELTATIGAKDVDIPDVIKAIGEAQQAMLKAQVASGAGGYQANAVTPPGYGAQVAPVPVQSAMLGLAAGLALGGLATALAELSDKSFKSPAEIRRRLGLPVIGHVPQFRAGAAEPNAPDVLPALVTALRPKSGEAEAYRGVRTQLYFSTQGRGHQVIQVTSPNPGDGKSTLAANLAVSIAQSGKRTVLIDCDFRKPQVHKIFKLDKVEIGLSSVVAGTSPIARALRPSAIENLYLMPCGARPDNPAELLTSPKFQQLLSDLKDGYDFVVVDTPPLLAVSDPAAVAPRVDGVILVFRMSKSARPSAERAREQLAAIGANTLGVVVNGGVTGPGYNYGSNYGYRYIDYEYADHYAETAD